MLPEDRPPSAQFVRYELYHIYNEIDPNFSVPEEAMFTDWRHQSDKIDQSNSASSIKQNSAPPPGILAAVSSRVKAGWRKLFQL